MKGSKDKSLVLIGKRIRKIRESTGMTQDQAALEIGFSRSYYGEVERGVRNISSLNLVKIAKNFKVEVGNLFPAIDEL
ncbi:MAG: helix-turn-helix domain-containing protein [Arenicella sp.]